MTSYLVQLEHPAQEADLDATTKSELVVFALNIPNYWSSKALDWVDDGILSEPIMTTMRQVSQDKRYSQRTRHRAWQHVKHRA